MKIDLLQRARKEEARDRAMETDLFEQCGNRSERIRCTRCGQTGYPGGSWMDKHIGGHIECWCGKVTATATLRHHLGHRTHPKEADRGGAALAE